MYAWLDYALFYLTKELEKSFLILKLDTTMSFCLLSFLTLHIEWPQKNKQNLCNWKESIHFLFDWSQSIREKFDLILYIYLEYENRLLLELIDTFICIFICVLHTKMSIKLYTYQHCIITILYCLLVRCNYN